MDRNSAGQSFLATIRGNSLASIWLIPAAALLVAAAVLIRISHDEYAEDIEQEYQFLDAHARIAQSQISAVVRNVRVVLTRIANELPEEARSRAEYAARLAHHNREVPEIGMLAVLDPTGRIEMSTDPRQVGSDASRHEYFTAHRDSPGQSGFLVTRPYKDMRDYRIGFSLPMRNERQQLRAIAIAEVEYAYLDAFMKDLLPAQSHSSVSVVNDNGDFLYHVRDPEKNAGKNVSGNRALKDFLGRGRRTSYDIAVSQTDGIERMYVFRGIPDTPISIAVSRPVDDVLATWRRDVALRIVLFVLCAALILRLTWAAHRRQREAQEGKAFTDRLIETTNAMMVGVDIQSRIIAVNAAAESITGYSREELIGRSIFDTLMPSARFPRAWRMFLRHDETGRMAWAFEAPILTRGGEERVVAWQNSRVTHDGAPAILSFGIDVTERAQLQQLRSREETSRRLVTLQEEERRRLAFELHDRTSPNLSILDINLKLLTNSLPKEASSDIAHLIDDTSATLTDTIAAIRSVALDFHPPLLDYAGLWPALNAYTRQFCRRTGIAVRIAEEENPVRLARDVETNLFHIAQEALANCAKYSHAETIYLRQTNYGNEYVLAISDDGAGFDVDACGQGQGLLMMRKRAEFIGGKFHLDSHPGKGTRIAVSFNIGTAAAWCDTSRAGQWAASQASAPSPTARPLAKQAVSK